jgi:hypothetical protein
LFPLSEKNKDLDESYVQEVCDTFGVDCSRPIVIQISRFDRLKDPLGVIHVCKMASGIRPPTRSKRGNFVMTANVRRWLLLFRILSGV